MAGSSENSGRLIHTGSGRSGVSTDGTSTVLTTAILACGIRTGAACTGCTGRTCDTTGIIATIATTATIAAIEVGAGGDPRPDPACLAVRPGDRANGDKGAHIL